MRVKMKKMIDSLFLSSRRLIWRAEKYIQQYEMQKYAITECAISIHSRKKGGYPSRDAYIKVKDRADLHHYVARRSYILPHVMRFYFLTIGYTYIDRSIPYARHWPRTRISLYFCFPKIMIWIIAPATDEKWRNLIRKKKKLIFRINLYTSRYDVFFSSLRREDFSDFCAQWNMYLFCRYREISNHRPRRRFNHYRADCP